MNGKGATLVVAVIALCSATAVAGVATPTSGYQVETSPLNGTLTSSNGVVYHYDVSPDDLSVSIDIENPTNRHQRPSIEVEVDKWGWHTIDTNLSSGETSEHEVDIRRSIDVLNDTHTVTVSTFGNWTDVTFTTTVEDLERNDVPKPHISDVQIVTAIYDGPFNTTLDGKRTTMAHITVTNPTNQLYSMKLMVHSIETGGGWYPSSVPRGENRTMKAVLDEDFGETVAGEARLYTGSPSEVERALDQVEFVGRADGETHTYDRPYRPVTPPWGDDPYQYENESVSRGDGVLGTDVESLDDVPAVAYLGGVLVVVALVLLRRR